MASPNVKLRAMREATPSRLAPGDHMSRSEVAQAVNKYLWEMTGKRYELDGHAIARYERGDVLWPSAPYRAALRAVLGVDWDSELGFRPTRRGSAAVVSSGVSDSASGSGEGVIEMPLTRRAVLSIAAVAAVNAAVVNDFVSSISGQDMSPLTEVQTTYDVDRAIASEVDAGTRKVLCRWATGSDNPIARVNATGILAKLPDQSVSNQIVTILQNDTEVRRLYLTAVTARICFLAWDQAAAFVRKPTEFSFLSTVAERFAREAVNPTDVGARWCSAKMLQDLSPAIGR